MIPISLGGTGGKTAAEARTNFGLGSAALLNDSEATGSVLKRGQGIVNSDRNTDASIFGYMAQVGFGTYRFNAAQAGNIQRYSTGIYANASDTHAFIQVNYQTGIVEINLPACAHCSVDNFGRRPPIRPFSRAAANPARVRSTINSLSISASADMM